MAVDHYENFPVASWLCPPRLRPAVIAIYRFARTADDLADEGDAPPQQRLDALAAYRRALDATLQGHPASPRWARVFDPLAAAVRRHGLPPAPLHALLDAFEQDVANPAYADRAGLLAYCRRSADPVGRLLLHLHGIGDAPALRQSDAVCSALQLANFWQDLQRDLQRGRCYVPRDSLARHGLDRDALRTAAAAGHDTSATRALVRELVAWARELMDQGAPLAMRLPGRAGWELRLVIQGGLRILEKIDTMNHAALSVRPTIGAGDAPRLLWRALAMRSETR